MLAGIKKGKRKRQSTTGDATAVSSTNNKSAENNDLSVALDVASTKLKKNNRLDDETATRVIHNNTNNSKSNNYYANSNNQNAADELRQMLAGMQSRKVSDKSSASTAMTLASSASTPAETQSKPKNSVLERYEQRLNHHFKTINDDSNCNLQQDPSKNETIVLINSTAAASSSSSKPILSKEDFRHGSRKGKLLKETKNKSYMKADEDKSISQMIQEEKNAHQLVGGGRGGNNTMSMDEIFARNVVRMGSKYKGLDFKTNNPGSKTGADEDDGSSIDHNMNMFTSTSDMHNKRLTDVEKYNREISRQLAYTKKSNSITNKCWWWIESDSFQKHRLIALGDHVSLMLIPSHLQLVPNQCYLVPIQHSDAFVNCEEEVWDEVQRFKSSLRRMFQQNYNNHGVLFCETVLSTNSFWQSRIDVIPVPMHVQFDAEMYFKSALTEQAEEWGTHTKLLSTKGKTLRQTIPKGFSYFHVEWSNDGSGFAQIIENNKFPKDFGVDTIAGMMGMDPIRFGRKKKAADYDRSAVMEFVKNWEPFDWTVALDTDTTNK